MKMKLLRLISGVLLATLTATTASAQVLARDDAAAYTTIVNNSGWAFSTTTNGGYGFNPWVFRTNGLNFSGFYVKGDETQIGTTNTKAWGMYANSNNTVGVKSAAFRSFTNALPVNSVFKIKWRNLGIGGADHLGGFALRNGNANSAVTDADPAAARFAFYYLGGLDDNFRYFDGNGGNATGLGFGSGPFELSFILLTTDTYRLIVKNGAGSTVITNYEGTLAGTGTIDSLSLFAFATDGDQIFNALEISTTSLIAPVIQNVSPANGSAYVLSSAPVTFEVASPFSGVSSNNISLSLNGTTVTGLGFTGSNGFWSVTKSGALAPNVTYNARVIATDANGNRATNDFSFNTWTESNFFIEAEAYNYTSGNYIPSPFPGQYDTLGGFVGATNGVDFLEFTDAGTNGYRTLDPVDLERSGDLLDHAGYAGFALENWMLSYVQQGEWQNYTRRTSNTTYNVYARISAGGNNPVMLMERLANPTATSSNQPLAALGTFVGTNTGNIVSNFTFVPLKDFNSSNVLVRFSTSSLTTNTFRLTRIGDGYNFDYLIFVPSTDASTLRPYLATGFPFPNAANVEPDQTISFTIANRQTTVTAASIKLYVNNVNVTGSTTTSSNAAGTFVSYTPATLYAAGTNIVRAEYTDSGSVSQTNNWQFTVANIPVIPTSYALPSAGANRGFAIRVAKATNSADLALFPLTFARIENHLANLINDPNTGLPFFNEAGGPNGNGRYYETNAINYNQAVGFGDSGIAGDVLFPYVAQTNLGSYTDDPDFISMEAIAYAQLTPGIYKWAVRSDDGFRLTFGTGANPTNLNLAEFIGGRGDGTPSEFEFIVQTNGLYPFRLIYHEGTGFASCELYSINRANGTQILINDLANGAAVQTFRDVPVTILNSAHSGSSSTFSFATQAGRTHTVQYRDSLTTGTWQTLTVVAGSGSATNITDSAATAASRFYRVSSQ
ncbi:MAG: hypothetical protein EXS35_16200 [Pedosphaera sp.]|nr:hypothetical protein [Pedosphaera sp.]